MDAAQQTEQMASFTMVEQITNMANDNAKTAAVGMIGHTVAYTTNTKTGETVAGTVDSVSIGHDGNYTLTVDGQSGIDPTLHHRSRLIRRRKGADAHMMRGMFAAISGLKNHQMMLDVTANDIANVNTIGYKSARTTFKDSLTQMQRGAAAPSAQQRRLQRGPGRPRRRRSARSTT